MRLFVAIALPEDVKERLAALQRGLREARWITAENLHLTLRFLGELDGRQAGDVDDALSALRYEAFDLELAGINHFGDGRNLRTLWVGVTDPVPVVKLQAKIERAIQLAGIEPETRKFKAHVTLARFKKAPGPAFADYLRQNALFKCRPFTVGEVILYSSHLAREGSIYRLEARYPLVENRIAASSDFHGP